MNSKPTIYPELIKPGEWHVEEWRPGGEMPAPCVSNDTQEMHVPKGSKPFAKEIRFHELLHVKYSPACLPTEEIVSRHSMLAAEDCRVNFLGSRIREHDALKYAASLVGELDPFQAAAQMPLRAMAQTVAGRMNYASSDENLENLADSMLDVRDNADLPEWMRRHAMQLRRTIRQVQEEANRFFGLEEGFDSAIALARWLDSFDNGTPGPAARKPGDEDEDGEIEYEPSKDGDGAGWGTMKIDMPKLTRTHRSAMRGATVPSLSGTRPSKWNRLATGEIFGRPVKRGRSGAVLIDQSGSMSWDSSKLEELVKQMPVGVVAGYCGQDGHGILRILAKDGRMVPSEMVPATYDGNEVDGPALKWLARQKGSKVWVSDEGVCADVPGDDEERLRECRDTCKRAGIRISASTDPADILRILRRR
jgi:hypothetical protein